MTIALGLGFGVVIGALLGLLGGGGSIMAMPVPLPPYRPFCRRH